MGEKNVNGPGHKPTNSQSNGDDPRGPKHTEKERS